MVGYINTTKRTQMRINGKIRENHLIISDTKNTFLESKKRSFLQLHEHRENVNKETLGPFCENKEKFPREQKCIFRETKRAFW